jgi:hypothetical protein
MPEMAMLEMAMPEMAMPEMAMPEMAMPETAKLGKTIARKEWQMSVQTCHRRDIQEPVVRHQAGMMMIPSCKELVITETLWEIVWEKDSCRNKMHVTDWTESICAR